MEKEKLIGNKYGKLTVVDMIYNYNNTGKTKCICNCDCGTTNIIRSPYQIKHANNSSCGCAKKENVRKAIGKDIKGQKFGKLLVLDVLWENNPPKVKCLCDCGNIVILSKRDVQNNHVKSCGCLKKDTFSKLNYKDYSNYESDYGITILSPSLKNKNNQQLWKCQCSCGNYFDELPARIINNHVRSCGCLKQSSREKMIEQLLQNNSIKYETQYSFDDCKSNRGYVLHFDFAIFKNDILNCLIEYDGLQHFQPIDYFGGEEKFKENIERDNIKNIYCKTHNINLYRLNYKMDEKEIKEKIINIINP